MTWHPKATYSRSLLHCLSVIQKAQSTSASFNPVFTLLPTKKPKAHLKISLYYNSYVLLTPWRGYLEQRLDKVQRIKWVFIKRPSKDTPWAAQSLTEATPKMDNSHEFLSWIEVWSICISEVNCPIRVSGNEVTFPQFASPSPN